MILLLQIAEIPVVTYARNGHLMDIDTNIQDEASAKCNLQTIIEFSPFNEYYIGEKIALFDKQRTGTQVYVWNLMQCGSEYSLEWDAGLNGRSSFHQATFLYGHAGQDVSLDYSLRSYLEVIFLDPQMAIKVQGSLVKSRPLARFLNNTSIKKGSVLNKPVQLVLGHTQHDLDQRSCGIFLYWHGRLIEQNYPQCGLCFGLRCVRAKRFKIVSFNKVAFRGAKARHWSLKVRKKNNFKSDRPRDERRNDHRNKETYHPYVAPRRDQGRGERYRQDYRPFEATGGGHQCPGIGALTKPPREILATERQLNLQAPRPTGVRTTKENSDKFCEYHKEHGHITNHCKQLKKQLEIALESGRLDHLLRDWKQRDTAGDRGTSKNNDKRNDKVINMIRSHKGMKMRNGDREEGWMKAPITFPPITTEDLSDEPLIVEGDIAGYLVWRIYVDEGSSVDVIETSTSLIGFSGETNKPLGKIELEVRFGDNGMYRRTMMTFCVVRSPSPDNVILGRTGLKEMRAIPSTIHSMIKFPTPKGIATLIARPSMVSECHRLEEKQTVEKPKVVVPQEAEITGEDDVIGTEEVLINPAYPEQLVVIGKGFSKDARRNLIDTPLKVGRENTPA
ncbi:histidine kinase-like ATPase domain, Zinc finger, CW-type [Artemisia annua]|uniref:Histidine kinase-like ATPase domain, Zinc finger, CW-type n=1 Tax=Artemisia annua TaxID=35608 RepID=A0A2U1QMH7_ARTAN|nr:histidine kinase-like ATPase domain, Zinc finger, CW-type [Artemisia annua]